MLAQLTDEPRFGAGYLRRPGLRRAALAVAAVTASMVALRYGAEPAAAVAAAAAFVLVVLAAIDLEQRRVPNAIVLPAAALVLAGRIATDPDRAWVWAAAAFAAALAFFLLALAYPPGLGMGDVKLVLLIGATLGSSVVVGLLLGTLTAGLTGAALLARHGAAARRRSLAYAPFLCFGALVTLLLVRP
jgi:leader peptidase (prepilin peptidase) / N-methyltransferase